MELSKELTFGLKQYINLEDKVFTKLLIESVAVLNENKQNIRGINSSGQTEKQIKSLQCSCLVTFLAECSRKNLDSNRIQHVLKDLDWTDERISQLIKALEVEVLSSSHHIFSTLLPHLVDISWALTYSETSKDSVYTLKLKTQKLGKLDYVTLHCSVPQLIKIMASLKQAEAAVNRLVNS